MGEDIRKTADKFLKQLKSEVSKPKNIYEFETVVPNYILLPFKDSMEELINKNKEQEKIIELMAFELSTEDENYLYRSISDIINCFEKKAKGE